MSDPGMGCFLLCVLMTQEGQSTELMQRWGPGAGHCIAANLDLQWYIIHARAIFTSLKDVKQHWIILQSSLENWNVFIGEKQLKNG